MKGRIGNPAIGKRIKGNFRAKLIKSAAKMKIIVDPAATAGDESALLNQRRASRAKAISSARELKIAAVSAMSSFEPPISVQTI